MPPSVFSHKAPSADAPRLVLLPMPIRHLLCGVADLIWHFLLLLGMWVASVLCWVISWIICVWCGQVHKMPFWHQRVSPVRLIRFDHLVPSAEIGKTKFSYCIILILHG
jgi:hypothetical protein